MEKVQCVLIADDNRDAADTLAMCLRQVGHDVFTAYDGSEAYAKACVLNPDVLLIDLAMPKVDGYELADRLRHEKNFQNALLIAVSGFADEKHRLLSDRVGFHFFFAKPVDPTMLHALLQSHWDRKAHESERSKQNP
jgi:DNA-binding response OmpR family regulator